MTNFILAIAILVVLQIFVPFRKQYDVSGKVITYTKDAKPIIEKRCAQCHNKNWPDKDWTNYETAFKNKDKIKLRVANQTMPPGNNTNITKEERQALIDWANDGGQK